LRRFCDGEGQLWTFDKRERRSFRAGPRNVAAERGLYDIEGPDGRPVSLEDQLGQLEGDSAAIVTSILEREEIGFLTPEQRRTLCRFAAAQFVRIPGHRERFRDMTEQFRTWVEERAPPGADLSAIPHDLSEEKLRLFTLKSILDSLRELAPHFYSKAWLLLEAAPNRPFWISDNPVTMHNSRPAQAKWMGNIGLAVRGIQIYLPLSSHYALSFVCPTVADEIVKGNEDSIEIRHEWNHPLQSAEGIGHLADGVRYGFPVPSKPENMDFMNSLQVSRAERWIFSATSDFGLAEIMLVDNPDLATGPRMTMG
jgi:hypothetical protein